MQKQPSTHHPPPPSHHHHHARKTLCFSKILIHCSSCSKSGWAREIEPEKYFLFTPRTTMLHVPWSKEDGDKRYLGNEVDLQRVDYDVTCLDKIHHKKLLFYISFCFCFWVRSRFCFVFLVMGCVFPFRRFVFLFRVLGFRFCLYASF